jgi:hypothetical protein
MLFLSPPETHVLGWVVLKKLLVICSLLRVNSEEVTNISYYFHVTKWSFSNLALFALPCIQMLLLKCLSICDSKYVECVIIFFCSSNQILDFKQLTTNICHFIKQESYPWSMIFQHITGS